MVRLLKKKWVKSVIKKKDKGGLIIINKWGNYSILFHEFYRTFLILIKENFLNCIKNSKIWKISTWPQK